MKARPWPWLFLLCALALAGSARAEERAHARVQLLAFNDFHGQLGTGREHSGRPAGSAAVLGAYLRDAAARFPGGSLIVHAGDFVGGSPHASSLLQDEPSIAFLNLLGNEFCRGEPDERCNVVGTLGNHEFDEGVGELWRLLRGGNAEDGPFLEDPWRGARVRYVCANVIDEKRNRPWISAFSVHRVDGVRVGVIGAVLTATAHIVLAEGLRGVRFEDEAASINRAVRELRRRGVQAIVVTIHQGAGMIPYEGPTRRDVSLPAESDIAQIVGELDPAVDVVVSGHAHQFTNAYVSRGDGHEILITQVYSAGTAYAEVELAIDRRNGDVVDKVARIVPTYADEGPGLSPAPDIAALAERAEATASALLTRIVGSALAPLSDVPNRSGESSLGNFLADAQRAATNSQIAFVNQGSIRADLPAGPITLGRLLAIQPFGSVLVTMELTGSQIHRLLEQQWEYDPPHILRVSGLTYSWHAALPVGKRVVAARVGGEPLRDELGYRVAVSDYLGRGGGGFPVFAEGTHRVVGPRVIDALQAFLDGAGGVARARIEARVLRRD